MEWKYRSSINETHDWEGRHCADISIVENDEVDENINENHPDDSDEYVNDDLFAAYNDNDDEKAEEYSNNLFSSHYVENIGSKSKPDAVSNVTMAFKDDEDDAVDSDDYTEKYITTTTEDTQGINTEDTQETNTEDSQGINTEDTNEEENNDENDPVAMPYGSQHPGNRQMDIPLSKVKIGQFVYWYTKKKSRHSFDH